MAKTIVSIISQQPTPNYLLIRELFEPGDDLLFITSTKMQQNIKPIVETLNWSSVEINQVILSEGEEERWDAMCKTIESSLTREKHYAVNLTGGTKYMALAVQSVFEKYNSQFYYIPFPKNVILSTDSVSPITTRVSVKEYMSLHGHAIKSDKTIRTFEESSRMLNIFANHLAKEDFNIINRLREYRDSNIKISWVETKEEQVSKPSIPGLKTFLDKIGFIPQTEDTLTKYESRYLTGGWFEEYVFFLIKQELDVTDILFGVKLNETHNDLDVVFTINNRLFVVECKTGIDKGSMLNQIAYKSSALNDYLRGLSSKSYIFALATSDSKWSVIPNSMGITYYGRDFFIDETQKSELIASLKKATE